MAKKKGKRTKETVVPRPSYNALHTEVAGLQGSLRQIVQMERDANGPLTPRQLAQAECALKALDAVREATECVQGLGPYDE